MKWSRIGLVCLIAPLVWLATPASANNMLVTNAALSSLGSGRAAVDFDLSWDNSWRDSTNFDACWVFVKYSIDRGHTWKHATMGAAGTNPADFSGGSMAGIDIVVPGDRKGAFFQRTGEGSGTVASSGARLVWDFAADGVSANAEADVRVFAVEMVYVPEGPFYCGNDDTHTQSTFFVTYINTADMSKLTAEGGSGTVAAPYYNNTVGMGRPYGVTGTFNTNYPNGYKAFYMMKYELTQGQYADFLNTLSYAQAVNQFPPVAGTLYTITGVRDSAAGTYTFQVTAPHRALGFPHDSFQSAHGIAFADWAALRPFTELEYEKACRGPELPVPAEFPWGDTNYWRYTAVSNAGTATEGPTNELANLNILGSAPVGPIRSGAFATVGSSRVKAGASYYGILELAGNVTERVVASGAGGRSGGCASTYFNASEGDGELDSQGYANNTNWPAGFQIAFGRVQNYGHRGLAFRHPWFNSQTAARPYGTVDYPYNGYDFYGFRAVRNAP